uniref:Uncharacterized protein n=1 Tax=Pararge aegeria TaxID=116150 RepID=S4PT89_9NEOP
MISILIIVLRVLQCPMVTDQNTVDTNTFYRGCRTRLLREYPGDKAADAMLLLASPTRLLSIVIMGKASHWGSNLVQYWSVITIDMFSSIKRS